jgi:hypothetical protein
MFYQKLFALVLCFFIFGQSLAQDKPTTGETKTDVSAELKKEAMTLLREAAQDVANLRTLENRISFSAEIASLMWFDDERQARAMFQSVVTDFRELLIQIDGQYTASDASKNEEIESYDPFFGSPQGGQAKLSRKLTKALGVRQQIALSIAEHDPQMGYDFFISTSQAVTNPQLRSTMEGMDSYFEFRLLDKIAEKDPNRALEAGRKILARGFNYQIANLLTKIYERDADKGAIFGDEVLQKIKSEKTKADSFYQYSSILNLGAQNLEKIKDKPGKKPMFSGEAMREIADLLAQEILKRDAASGSEMLMYVSLVEKFSPARAAQIKQKFAASNERKDANQMTRVINGTEELGEIREDSATTQLKTQADIKKQEEQLFKDAENLSAKQLSREEREKLIGEAQKTIAKMKSSEQKIMVLTVLALHVVQSGDKELASKIMDDARKLTTPEPKNYREFLQAWLLTSGYAQVDADKAFPILEDTILRINETINAFIKVGEFMDLNGEIIEDGEVQIGSFGGEMTRIIPGELGTADASLRSLAIADFARTKALTNKFDRLEARILAKMLVLRAVLGDKKESSPTLLTE